MKTITIHFENSEFKQLKRTKKKMDLNWHDFVLSLLKYNDSKKKNIGENEKNE